MLINSFWDFLFVTIAETFHVFLLILPLLYVLITLVVILGDMSGSPYFRKLAQSYFRHSI